MNTGSNPRIGSEEVRLDAGGRFVWPKRFRLGVATRTDEGKAQALVLEPVLAPDSKSVAIRIVPEEAWSGELDALRPGGILDSDEVSYHRKRRRLACHCHIDGRHRLLVPASLLALVGIDAADAPVLEMGPGPDADTYFLELPEDVEATRRDLERMARTGDGLVRRMREREEGAHE